MNDLCDDEIVLHLQKEVSADPSRGWLQAYHFDILMKPDREKIGSIDLRIGYTTSVVRYGGHLGYGIDANHRGNRYAAKACKLLLPVAKQHGMDVIWVTCNPDNFASRRTCEIIGAELVEVVDIPPDNDQYQDGERQKCRYRLVVY
jgi:tagatose 1,6-diphosphate aldolase